MGGYWRLSGRGGGLRVTLLLCELLLVPLPQRGGVLAEHFFEKLPVFVFVRAQGEVELGDEEWELKRAREPDEEVCCAARSAEVARTQSDELTCSRIASVPVVSGSSALRPVRRAEPCSQTHPVCDALDEPAVARPHPVPLPHVDELMYENAKNLAPDPNFVSCDAGEVRRREVDLLVRVVELAAVRVCDAVESTKVKSDGADLWGLGLP